MNKKFYPSNIWQALLAFIVPMIIISPILFLTNGKIEQDLESLIIFVLIGIGFSLFTYLINRKRNIPMRYSFKWPKTQWLLLLIGIVILYQLGINNPLFKLIR